MNDSIGAVLALGVAYLIFRCLCSRGGPSRSPSAAASVAERARAVPDDQVASVRSMFPQIPEAAVRADLARSHSTQATVERILRDGSLPLPRGLLPTPTPTPTPAGAERPSLATSSSSTALPPDLLTRYGLSSHTAPAPETGGATDVPAVQPGWSHDRNEREQALRKRKEAAILQARQ